VIWLLTRELARLGHQRDGVWNRGFEVTANWWRRFQGPTARKARRTDWYLCEWVNLCRAGRTVETVDVRTATRISGEFRFKRSRAGAGTHDAIVPDDNSALLWEEVPDPA